MPGMKMPKMNSPNMAKMKQSTSAAFSSALRRSSMTLSNSAQRTRMLASNVQSSAEDPAFANILADIRQMEPSVKSLVKNTQAYLKVRTEMRSQEEELSKALKAQSTG